jgi:hypothetical protein
MKEKSSKELKTSLFVFTEMSHQRSSNIIRHVVDTESIRRLSLVKLSSCLNELIISSLEILNTK